MALCVSVCFPIESVVSQFSSPSAPPLLAVWELSVSFGKMDCGGRDLRELSTSLEPAWVVSEREGMGQRLTDGLSATRTAGRWLWQFGQGRNFGLLSFEKMLEEAADYIPLSCPEQTLSPKTCKRWGGRGEAGEWGRVRDWDLLKKTALSPTLYFSCYRVWGRDNPTGWEAKCKR